MNVLETSWSILSIVNNLFFSAHYLLANNIDRPPEDTGRSMHKEIQTVDTRIQTFEVQVPGGVRPGQSFALMAGGQRVLISCPPNALPGKVVLCLYLLLYRFLNLFLE